MSQGQPIEERREAPYCNQCVKDEFNQMKGGDDWQKWAIRVLIFVFVIGGGLNGWAVFASNDKDSKQDSRITAVETNQNNILKNQEDQKKQLQQLIALTTQTNILVQTHIARNPDR